MKKIFTFLTALVLTFSLAACNGEEEKNYEELLDEAYESLSIYSTDINDITGDFVLPLEARNDVTISWNVSHDDVLIFGEEVSGDIQEQEVEVRRPEYEEGNTELTLTATLSLEDYERTKEFEGIVRSFSSDFSVYDNIEELLENAEMGDELRVEGTVVGFQDNRTFFIGDGTSFISLFDASEDFIGDLEIGDEIEVIGERSEFSGLQQISNLEISVIDHDQELPDTVDMTDFDLSDEEYLKNYQSHLIEHNDLTVADIEIDEYENIIFTLENSQGQEIMARYDSRLRDSEDLAEMLKFFVEGEEFIFSELVLGWNSGPEIKIF